MKDNPNMLKILKFSGEYKQQNDNNADVILSFRGATNGKIGKLTQKEYNSSLGEHELFELNSINLITIHDDPSIFISQTAGMYQQSNLHYKKYFKYKQKYLSLNIF